MRKQWWHQRSLLRFFAAAAVTKVRRTRRRKTLSFKMTTTTKPLTEGWTNVVALPRLATLCLYGGIVLVPFALPTLTSLTIAVGDYMFARLLRDMPTLRHLKILRVTPDGHGLAVSLSSLTVAAFCRKSMTAQAASGLTLLDVSNTGLKMEGHEALCSLSLPALQYLSLASNHDKRVWDADLLRPFPRLRCVHTTDCGIRRSALAWLLSRSAAAGASSSIIYTPPHCQSDRPCPLHAE
jgi:hypothetical protein